MKGILVKNSKSWDVNFISEEDEEKQGRSWWEKLQLLLWKNWTIQMRHKWQTLIEIILPLLFTIMLVIIRLIVKTNEFKEPTYYPKFEVFPPTQPFVLCENFFYAPQNEMTDKIMSMVKQDYFDEYGFMHFNFTGFDSKEELEMAYLKAAAEVQPGDDLVDIQLASPSVLAAIYFRNNFTNGELPENIEYEIRFPSSLRGNYDIIEEKTGLKAFWYTEIMYPLIKLIGPRARNKTYGGLPGYTEEGFLFIQKAVDNTFMKLIYESSPEDLQRVQQASVKLQRFPYVPYSHDYYMFALQAFLPCLMLLSFIYPVINISKSIVTEKEKRLKESMKMMGLSNWLHWVAWFIKSYVFLMISTLFITILLKVQFASWTVPIVPKTDGTVIYFIFLVFSISVICFCFFVSSLFSKANPAATGAGALWILFYVPYVFLQPRYNLLPFYVKLLFCIMFNTPISFACQIICMFEGTGEGLQWGSLNEGTSPDDDFTMVHSLFMMMANSVLYLVITLYVEAVWPGEYGIPLPWNFFLKKWYWLGKTRECDFEFEEPTPKYQANYEPNSQKLRAGIQIKSLTKQYGKKTAVDDLCLDIFEGQITALLGHNGAGKTTTISILTGLFPPTSGTALIAGYDIHRDMEMIRNNLGICPQHDVLFDELTVAEHLQFFCLLKGMNKKKVPQEIDRLLKALGLENKRNAKSRTLSGGQKRKLSVLIAFCAGSKVVLLDECTSGMDSGSRRCTWDLIQSEKKGRTIILSTHFMEEADVLGDRIAIMAEGILECCGSSLYLKKRYGGGYHLIIVKTPDCVVDNITNLLKTSIPEAEVDQNVGAELSYVLPDSKSHIFPTVFEELEKKREELGIASYGASITTMEEVFMRVLKDAEYRKTRREKDELEDSGQSYEIESLPNYKDDSLLFGKEVFERNQGVKRLTQQFWAMVVKKILYAYRNRFLIISQMILPLVYLIILFLALQAWPGFNNPVPLDISSLDRYETVAKTETIVKCTSPDSVFCNNYIDYVNSIGFSVKDITESNKTVSSEVLDLASKELNEVNFKYIVSLEEEYNPKTNKTDLVGLFNNQPYHGPPTAFNFITNALIRNSNYSIKTINHPLPYSTLDSVKDAGGVLTLGFQVGYNIAIALSFLTAGFMVFIVKERESGCKHLQFVSGVNFLLFWVANFLVDFIQFIISALAVCLTLYLYNIEEFTNWKVQYYFMILLTLFGCANLPLIYLSSYLASNPTTGYSRMVVFNCFIGLAPMLTMVFISLPGFNLEYLGEDFNNWFLVSPNYAMGQGVVQLSTNFYLNRFCGQVQFLDALCDGTTPTGTNYCCEFVRNDFLDWERMGIGKNVFYMSISAGVLTILLFLVEFKIFKKIKNLFVRTKAVLEDSDSGIEDPVGLEDSDVLEEEEKIKKTSLNELFKSHNLVVRDLTKLFDNFVAVDHLNFSVVPGECFGLLGVNGAGKTTTFKQLTGDIPVTSGDAFVKGESVSTNIRGVHESIGYTPQFDGLIDEMTGRESIRMFSRLKGVPENRIKDLIRELGDVLLFSQHLDKRVCELSGGNKRKLSTACSLVGKPAVVLLDEPSSGMDPVARRHLWNAVSMIRDAGTSIVLTTHSLEEAEALCTRMGIMVNGKFRCLGSPQHLKSKFSKGYTLIAQTRTKLTEDIPLTREVQESGRRRSSTRRRNSSLIKRSPMHWEANLEDLRAFIEDAFPGCVLKDIHPGFVHYHVMPSEETSWSRMFAVMEDARHRFDLEAYSVGQTSLEQVFLNFTKAQINNE